VATLSLGSPSTMRFRAKAKSGIRSTVAAGRVMLSMFLEHGDMVIMHGTKIHQYYEVRY
jgi:alkylated DNA repair dioxygenase AlkB